MVKQNKYYVYYEGEQIGNTIYADTYAEALSKITEVVHLEEDADNEGQ